MRQSYWNLTGNLWALALSTVIALFLPEFGPEDTMSGGVGVVIRATMLVPVVFSLMYWAGWLIINLTDKVKEWWMMSIITAGIERGIEDVAKRRAKKAAKEAAEEATRAEAERAAKARAAEREEAREFMRSKGIPEEDIDAFFRQLSSQD